MEWFIKAFIRASLLWFAAGTVLGLAVALLGDPHAVVLDEPSAALDPSGALRTRDLIAGIKRQGRTVLLCSHDLGEVALLADRIALFVAGRMCAARPHRCGHAATAGRQRRRHRDHRLTVLLERAGAHRRGAPLPAA